MPSITAQTLLSTLLFALSFIGCVREKTKSKPLASVASAVADKATNATDGRTSDVNDLAFLELCSGAKDPEVLHTLAILAQTLGTNDCKELGASLAGTVNLKLDGQDLIDISPLQYARSLTTLDLANNSIQDIKPIESLLSLRYLELSNNRIRDLSALRGMIEIKMLGISKNFISDLSPLATLRNINLLKASSNDIADLSPLRLIDKLTDLSIHSNPISDLSPLANLIELTALNLQNSPQVADLKPLMGLKKLETLDLAGTAVTDMSVVENFPLLHTFRVYGPSLINVASLAGLSALKNLEITYLPLLLSGDPLPALNYSFISQLSNLENLEINDYNSDLNFNFFASLTKLQRLAVNGNRIQDPTPLSRLTGLKSLNIDYLQSDTSFLLPLTNLEYLRIGASTLTNLNGLLGLSKLKDLVLIGAENTMDMTPINSLKNLQSLTLSDMVFGNLKFLEGLNQLSSFKLSRQVVTDISSLKSLPALHTLFIDRNIYAVDLQQIRGIKTLQKLVLQDNAQNLPIGLETLTSLRELHVDQVNLSDCTSMSALVQLTHLEIHRSQISNLDCLLPLTNLKSLSVAQNSALTAIPSMSGFKNLESIDLSETGISDLSPLRALAKVKSLYLESTPVAALETIFPFKRLVSLSIEGSSLAADTAKVSALCAQKDKLNDGIGEMCRHMAQPR